MSEMRKKLDPAAFCALPLVRRAYMASVVGLAVFIATLVVLREPFRGYLAEVRIAGPAIAGLDLPEAIQWLKQADEQVVVIATAAGPRTPRSQIRMTYLAPRPSPALNRLDELAGRWLYQYLPQRLGAFRHEVLADLRTAVNAARAQEDAASAELEALRQRQLALLLGPKTHERLPMFVPAPNPIPGPIPGPIVLAPAQAASDSSWRERVDSLRLELARLLASFTEEHPRVIALRSQIDRLERQAGDALPVLPRADDGPELIPAPAADRQAKGGLPVRPAAADHFVAKRSDLPPSAAAEPAHEPDERELAAAVAAMLARQRQASRERQAAEHRLSDRMQELSSQPTAAEWSAEPAHVVTRLGGTPRCATLVLATILAAAAGVVVFRGAAVAVVPARIESASELATVLELPVIGNVAALRRTAVRLQRRLFTAGRVQALVRGGELIVAAAVLACLLSVCVEPTLARQVLADPFGTLSEVLGRAGI
jgi:hypothetical protein